MPANFATLPIAAKVAFHDLATRLDPANLSCAGELSPAETEMRARPLRQQWQDLERQHRVVLSRDDALGFANEVADWYAAENARLKEEWQASQAEKQDYREFLGQIGAARFS